MNFFLGDIWHAKGNFNNAISSYNKALAGYKDRDRIYERRARVWLLQGNYANANFDLSKAIEINPQNAEAHNVYAWFLSTCPDDKYRNGTLATEYAKKALQLKPTITHFMDTLAAAYAETAQFNKAIETQKQAIRMLNKKDVWYKSYKKLYEHHLQIFESQKPLRDILIGADLGSGNERGSNL